MINFKETMMTSKALFLDRDGVINVDYGHVYKIENFHFIEGIFELCEKYQSLGYILIIVTNQAGIEKGCYSMDDYYILEDYMLQRFQEKNIYITDIYYEISADHSHPRRKPNPGMILEAIKKYSIDVSQSFIIGDKMSDLIAADLAGIKDKFLLIGKYPEESVNFLYKKINSLEELI